MSDKSDYQNLRGEQRENPRMSALALSMGQFEFTDAICDAMRKHVAGDSSGVKRLARAANANVRTVENWLAKRSTPDGLHLVRLMATVPEVQAEIRRLAAMQSDLDPHFERDFIQLMSTWQRINGGK